MHLLYIVQPEAFAFQNIIISIDHPTIIYTWVPIPRFRYEIYSTVFRY